METTVQQTRTESYYVIRHKASGLFVSRVRSHGSNDGDYYDYYLESDDIRQLSNFDGPYPFWLKGDQLSGHADTNRGAKTFAAETRRIIDKLKKQERELNLDDAEYSDFEVLKVQTIYEVVGEPISVE